MRNLIVALFMLVSALAAGQDRIVSSNYFTGDNEYQYSFRQYVGYERNMELKSRDTLKPNMIFSVTPAAGWRHYFYDGAYNTYADARVSGSYRRGRNFRLGASVSQLFSKEWSPTFMDGYARYSFTRAAFEAYFEREAVGTPVTNDLRYSSSSIGSSFDYRIGRKSTLVLGMSRNEITDGNVRWFQTARTIYAFGRNSYVDLKLRRMYGSEWSPYYFSPRSVIQISSGYGLYSDLKNGGSLKIYAGAGFQEIEGYVMSMFSVDAKISFPVSSRMECEVVAGSRNFNEYLYHTLSIRLSYDLKKKAIPNK